MAWLIARLLYGIGMRLMEGVRLRVKDVEFGRRGSTSFPVQMKFLAGGGTFLEVQVDQALVWDAGLIRHRFEVGDRLLVESDGHRLLELGSVRILSGSAEIVLLAHGIAHG